MTSFADFILSRNVTLSPRGTFIDDVKTLIHAGAFPDVREWADLYRLMYRRHASGETITLARSLWREYRKAASVGGNA